MRQQSLFATCTGGRSSWNAGKRGGSPAPKPSGWWSPLFLTNLGFLSLGWQDTPSCPSPAPSHKERWPSTE